MRRGAARRAPLLLGLDAGTSVVKAALLDLDGGEVAVASREVAVLHPRPGWAETDMNAAWDSACAAVRQVLAQVSAAQVQAVGLSGQGGGFWPVDRHLQPAGPAIVWLDSRAAPLLERWRRDGVLEAFYADTGWNPFPGLGPCVLVPYLAEHDPDRLGAVRHLLWAKDWLKLRLTGEVCTDPSDASNGHLSLATGEYSSAVLAYIGHMVFMDREVRQLLPPVVPSAQVAGRVSAEAAQATGLPQGIPVASGAWDSACSALGAGCVRPGQVVSVIGTAGAHTLVAKQPVPDPERSYSLSRHARAGLWLLNSLAMLGTSNLDWFRREFSSPEEQQAEREGKSVYDVLNAAVERIPVGAGGVIYLPFLQGERAPFNRPDARGVFFGLSDVHTRHHLLRAVYEGVALSAVHNYQALGRAGRIRQVTLAGGGSRSATWSQIFADCAGVPMQVPSGQELGVRGASMLAGVAAGLFPDLEQAVAAMVRIERIHRPDRSRHRRYQVLFHMYQQLIADLSPAWARRQAAGAEAWQ